jgi:hypothetical protein
LEVRRCRSIDPVLSERRPDAAQLHGLAGSGAKIFRRPFENIRKVEFSSRTETDTPSPLGHKGSIPLSWR